MSCIYERDKWTGRGDTNGIQANNTKKKIIQLRYFPGSITSGLVSGKGEQCKKNSFSRKHARHYNWYNVHSALRVPAATATQLPPCK
jgi:hypothetical protein